MPLTSARRRCGVSRRSIATSRASRSRRAATGWTSFRAFTPRRRRTSTAEDCWCAKSAPIGKRPKTNIPASNCSGPRTKCSCCRVPERPPLLEGGPRGTQRGDKPSFAALQLRGGLRLEVLQQPARDGDVVQLAEQVLQRLHTLHVGSVLRARKEGSKEFTGVAQAPEANAQRMPALFVGPIDAPRRFERLAMKCFEGLQG